MRETESVEAMWKSLKRWPTALGLLVALAALAIGLVYRAQAGRVIRENCDRIKKYKNTLARYMLETAFKFFRSNALTSFRGEMLNH
jgi:hypothetical protein